MARLKTLVRDRMALAVMLGRAGAWRSAAVLASGVASGLLRTLSIIASGLLIGSLPGAIGRGLASPSGHQALLGLGAVVVVSLVSGAVSAVEARLAPGLTARYVLALRDSLARVMLAPAGISHLEDPGLKGEALALDEVDRAGAQAQIGWPLIAVTQSRVSGVGACLILFGFRWWVPILLFAGWMGVNSSFRSWVSQGTTTFFERSTGLRGRASYLRSLLIEPGPAKEIRVFGMGGWALSQFAATWSQAMSTVWRARRDANLTWLWGVGAVVLVHAVVLSSLGLAAVQGQLSVGALTVYAQAVLGTAALGLFSDFPFYLARAATADAHLLELERRLGGGEQAPALSRSLAPDCPSESIRFEGIRFAYPGREEPVLEGLDLAIAAGQSLAIVGENGAGKSTLIRLLCGLYDPQVGRITVDGTDLREVDIGAWRAQIGVILQDFIRYHLPLSENVAMGRLELAADPGALSEALRSAGAADLPDVLPRGWETVLAPGYAGGTDLSGGQWQKVALARALLAVQGGARLLVLDEPTSNLDVRAEIELFDRFLELTRGVTTILVSHRLSSVRHAQRIVVLSGGRVVEDGNHAELIALGGRYAAMFRMQAQRFQEAPTDA